MGSGDPSPNPLTQRGLLLFLFPLNFPSCPELWFPEHGRWGTVGCGSPHPLPLPSSVHPPRLQGITAECLPLATGWVMGVLVLPGSWSCHPLGKALERVLLGPGKQRAGGRSQRAGGGPGPP